MEKKYCTSIPLWLQSISRKTKRSHVHVVRLLCASRPLPSFLPSFAGVVVVVVVVSVQLFLASGNNGSDPADDGVGWVKNAHASLLHEPSSTVMRAGYK